MRVDASVELTTAKALGYGYPVHYWPGLKTPVCTLNQFGKGRAILLNFSLFQAPAGNLLAELLAASGVTPAVRVTRPDGTPVKNVEVTRWNNGAIDLVALLADADGEVKVTLPASRVVADLKARRELGAKTDFTVALRANRAEFFALQAAPGMAPALELPAAVARGQATQARLSVPKAEGLHAVMLRAFQPNGQPAPWLDQTVLASGSAVTVTLPVAFNDPAGTWRVRATDLIGNRTTEARLTVH
jgi:hypothetical protein